jgi:hypothetical protein
MKKYKISLHEEEVGTLTFSGDDVEVDFLLPSLQRHFMDEVEFMTELMSRKPKTIEELMPRGYGMYTVEEVKGRS